jgi:hypothetical protein
VAKSLVDRYDTTYRHVAGWEGTEKDGCDEIVIGCNGRGRTAKGLWTPQWERRRERDRETESALLGRLTVMSYRSAIIETVRTARTTQRL